MSDSPYKSGFLIQFKRWLFGAEWAYQKIEQLRESIRLFGDLASKLPLAEQCKLWDSIERMRGEIDWLNSTIPSRARIREVRLLCPHCRSPKVKSDGDWDHETGQQTAAWYECLDCGECFN